MSPANAMDRSYVVLKDMLRQGVFQSGSKLEANRLALDLGVSMTPVRDALYRLAGERLVHSSLGDGFHVPRFSEAALRDLYEWISVLMSFACKTSDIRATMRAEVEGDIAERTASLVMRLSMAAPNGEIGDALRNASDRIHPFRIAESSVFTDGAMELDALCRDEGGIAHSIRRYHLRRMRAVAEIIRVRDRR